ncbi:MAG: hypothetical protein K6F01_05825 [Selenomonas sp.]|nr:hypothetical protein [Selenomonas sp.]MCR5438940.1 hypothetical protein [Selenomonas sp.]
MKKTRTSINWNKECVFFERTVQIRRAAELLRNAGVVVEPKADKKTEVA